MPFTAPHGGKFDPAEAMFTPAERAALRRMLAQFELVATHCPMAKKLTGS